MINHHVSVAYHADWSMDARKRWMTQAARAEGGWQLSAPQTVGDLATWAARLRGPAHGGAVALGVDLPLGLPRAYAAYHVKTQDFPSFLRALRPDDPFFQVCATLGEVGAARPFYPARGLAGMTRASHAAALGFDGPQGLSRACDRATADRPAGAPLFWTLGANQTGKAAISAWRDWLLPALAQADAPRLWPFEGDLVRLLTPGAIAVAETYPAEALRQLGLRMGGSKRRQADRAALAPALGGVMARLGAFADPQLRLAISDGFGADPAGEDRFDSVLGVLCLLAVLNGDRHDHIPDDPWIRRWEGWVLGQKSPDRIPASQ